MHRPTLIATALASVSVSALASETITYSYDARGRLVQVAHSGSVNNGVSTRYTLDKADNRTAVDVSGGGSPTPPVGPTPTPPTPTPTPAPAPAPAPTGLRAVVVPLAGFQIIPLTNQ